MAKTQKIDEEYTGTNYGPASARETMYILNVAYQARQPILIVGAPGVGKTAMLNKWSLDNGFDDPICLIGATLEPPDVTGLPHAVKDEIRELTEEGARYNGRLNDAIAKGLISEDEAYHQVSRYFTDFLIPVWQKLVFEGKPRLLFFDEFSNTPRMVQAAFLKIIGEKRFANGQLLPENCFIVAAMNPADSAVDYTPVSPAMINRLLMISYKPRTDEVVEGLNGGWFTDEQKEAWTPEERTWRSRIAGFLTKNSLYVLKENGLINADPTTTKAAYLDPDSVEDSSEREILTSTWASPRSWDNAAHVLGFTKLENTVTPVQERILCGMVGREATAELMQYVRRTAHLDPFDLIRDPSKQNWRVSNTEGTTANDIYELANSIIAKIPECDGQEGRPTVSDALDFFIKVEQLGGAPIFAPYFAKSAARNYISNNLPPDVSYREWMSKINGLLKKFAETGALGRNQMFDDKNKKA